jgi:hypothetical protein
LPGNALLLGEMGIGNTSAASLLLAALTGQPLADCVGAGTGLDEAGLARKLGSAAGSAAAPCRRARAAAGLAAFGGFEIATLWRGAAGRERAPRDRGGWLHLQRRRAGGAGAAPHVTQRCVFSHAPRERPCPDAAHLGTGASALLDLGLRLGEGSGAVLAWPLLQSACAHPVRDGELRDGRRVRPPGLMDALRHYLLALQFFTRVPVTGRLAAWVGYSPAMLRRARPTSRRRPAGRPAGRRGGGRLLVVLPRQGSRRWWPRCCPPSPPCSSPARCTRMAWRTSPTAWVARRIACARWRS